MGRRWYLFGPFRFDGELLYRDTTLISLRPKDAKLLLLLLENRGRLVKKDDLRDACGPGAVDNTVDSAISRLRRDLGGARPRAPNDQRATWIHTKQTEGYVFSDDLNVLEEPSLEAELDYHEGIERWNRREPEAVLRARDCVSRAIKREPRFALAHSLLADTYAVLGAYWWLTPHEAAAKAKIAAQRALHFDRGLAEPHATFGFVYSLFEHRWSEAEAAFAKCLECSPGYGVARHWYALHLAATGRLADAAREVDQALTADRSRSVDVHRATIRYWSRNYAEAETRCEGAIEEHSDFWYAHYQLGLVYEKQGRLQEALQKQRDSIACAAGPDGITAAALARACALVGQRDEALRLLARATSGPHRLEGSFHVAAVHEALGDDDLAFRELEAACAARDVWVSYLAVDPRLDRLRPDPRFAQVLARLDLSRIV